MNETERKCNRSAFLHLLQSMIGKEVTLDMSDGAVITGILHTSTLFHPPSSKKDVILKTAKLEKVSYSLFQRQY
jgi:hypothetical protein